MPSFVTWKFRGLAYLALRNPDGFLIVDAEGGFYGAWQDADSFRHRQQSGEGDWTRLGTVSQLAVHTATE